MLDSVRTLARISSTMSFSKLLALSLGVLQVPLPRLSRNFQRLQRISHIRKNSC